MLKTTHSDGESERSHTQPITGSSPCRCHVIRHCVLSDDGEVLAVGSEQDDSRRLAAISVHCQVVLEDCRRDIRLSKGKCFVALRHLPL